MQKTQHLLIFGSGTWHDLKLSRQVDKIELAEWKEVTKMILWKYMKSGKSEKQIIQRSWVVKKVISHEFNSVSV